MTRSGGGVVLTPGALAAMDADLERDVTVERGGVMVGRVEPCRDGTVLTVVTAGVPAGRAVGTPVSLTFTHDAWDEVTAAVEDRFPDLAIVGWYHSHPRLGVFLSPADRFICRHFFAGAGQVAYVRDPVADQRALFGWCGEDLVELPWG